LIFFKDLKNFFEGGSLRENKKSSKLSNSKTIYRNKNSQVSKILKTKKQEKARKSKKKQEKARKSK
jgi:hypothetical protein